MKQAKRRRLNINPAGTGDFLAAWLNDSGWGYPVEAQERLKTLLLALNDVRERAAKAEVGEAELGSINELLKEYPWVLVLRSPKALPTGRLPLPRLYFSTEPAGLIEQGHTWLHMLIELMSAGLLDRMRPCAKCGRWFYARLPKAQYHSTECRQAHFRSTRSKEEKAEYQKDYYRKQLSPNQDYYRTAEAVRDLKKKQKGTRRKTMTEITPGPKAFKVVQRDYPNKTDAEKWRLAQAEQMMMDFEKEMGRRSKTVKELEGWRIAHDIEYLDSEIGGKR